MGPVLGGALGTVDNAAGGLNRSALALAGDGINFVAPAVFGKPALSGYEYACAKASYEVYTSRHKRKDFTDKERDTWTYCKEDGCTDLIAAYWHGSSAIIASRGTVFSSGADLVSDAALLVGSCPPIRCAEFEKFVRSFCARNSQFKTIYLTGHSLGGCIAMKVGKVVSNIRTKVRVHVFNPGASPSDPLINDILNLAAGGTEVTIHRIKNDVISVFCGRAGGVKINEYTQGKFAITAHKIDQFL